VDSKSKLDDLTVKSEFNEAAKGERLLPDKPKAKHELRPPSPPGPSGLGGPGGLVPVSPQLRSEPNPKTPRQALIRRAFNRAARPPEKGRDPDLGR